MSRIDVYFSLGSNLGDRRRNMEAALGRLDRIFGRCKARSGFVESGPQGFFSEHKFLNGCALYALDRGCWSGPEVLEQCKRIEREMGRKEEAAYDERGRRIYRDRLIDIDILFFGAERISTERLTVPHPLMRERAFVMGPLREIAKDDIITAFPEIFA